MNINDNKPTCILKSIGFIVTILQTKIQPRISETHPYNSTGMGITIIFGKYLSFIHLDAVL